MNKNNRLLSKSNAQQIPKYVVVLDHKNTVFSLQLLRNTNRCLEESPTSPDIDSLHRVIVTR